MNIFKKYIQVWFRLAINNFSRYFANRLDITSYLLGKTIRFVFYFIFLLYLTQNIQGITGYTTSQVLLFYLVFNFIDITAQAFLRGTYDLANQISKRNFDTFLTQPINPIFRAMSNIVDGLDFITLFALLPLLIWSIVINLSGGLFSLLIFLVLLALGLAIALAFHILALAVGLLTFESHNVMFFYRNLLNMLRFPLDIYSPILQFIMVTIIPVGVMVAFPAKALLGTLNFGWVLYALLIAVIFLSFSLKFWEWSLKRYQGVSS